MSDQPPQPLHAPELAPVQLKSIQDDSVSHSLAILATVYHYNHWIFLSFRDFLGPAVVEVGSGIGNITQFLLNLRRVVCLEPYEPYRRYLVQRFAQHLNVSVRPHPVEACPNADVPERQFDSVLCINVLEHIADDVDALRRMRSLLSPGGNVIVLVPALPCVYGEMDRAMGHHRRYTLTGLRRAFRAAGLKPTHGRYMNMIGALGWWWRGRVRRKATIPESATRLFDRLVPVISTIERLIPPLLGQSAVIIGKG